MSLLSIKAIRRQNKEISGQVTRKFHMNGSCVKTCENNSICFSCPWISSGLTRIFNLTWSKIIDTSISEWFNVNGLTVNKY